MSTKQQCIIAMVLFVVAIACPLLLGIEREVEEKTPGVYVVTDKGIKRDVTIKLTATVCNNMGCVEKELTLEKFNSTKVGDNYYE